MATLQHMNRRSGVSRDLGDILERMLAAEAR
jgi:hypothetical protein